MRGTTPERRWIAFLFPRVIDRTVAVHRGARWTEDSWRRTLLIGIAQQEAEASCALSAPNCIDGAGRSAKEAVGAAERWKGGRVRFCVALLLGWAGASDACQRHAVWAVSSLCV